MKRFINFTKNLETHFNPLIRHLFKIVTRDTSTPTGLNLHYIMLLMNLNSINELSISNFIDYFYYDLNDTDIWKITLLKELIDIRSNILELDNLNTSEINDLIQYICTS